MLANHLLLNHFLKQLFLDLTFPKKIECHFRGEKEDPLKPVLRYHVVSCLCAASDRLYCMMLHNTLSINYYYYQAVSCSPAGLLSDLDLPASA